MAWLSEAPFDDPEKIRSRADFSYEDWFKRGRAIYFVEETLSRFVETPAPEPSDRHTARVAGPLPPPCRRTPHLSHCFHVFKFPGITLFPANYFHKTYSQTHTVFIFVFFSPIPFRRLSMVKSAFHIRRDNKLTQ